MAHDKVDPTRPHNARVWNYWLGGKDNYAVDRAFADQMAELLPVLPQLARSDRAFLRRAVTHLAGEAGIRQFLDIGTGLPSEGNTHEVAQAIAPDARIVYVDNDPLVLAHARALLTSTPEGDTQYAHVDAREPDKVLEAAAKTLDLTRPVAVTMLSILHFFEDAELSRTVRTIMDAMPPGSYLAVAHATWEYSGTEDATALEHWNTNSPTPIHLRDRSLLTDLMLDGLELLEPGIVSCARWRAEDDDYWRTAPEVPQYGLVARKP
ncbi:SAM-dependent methyltransferase [Streptomyces boninensis]|uniref:SAM-dependent methyltransferase n=1 Tax=Streptomyces boninensis TaxID=2039455 RepID=UPI003B216234